MRLGRGLADETTDLTFYQPAAVTGAAFDRTGSITVGHDEEDVMAIDGRGSAAKASGKVAATTVATGAPGTAAAAQPPGMVAAKAEAVSAAYSRYTARAAAHSLHDSRTASASVVGSNAPAAAVDGRSPTPDSADPAVANPRLAPSCDDDLAPWGVTRQYDFGQFVLLYNEQTVGGKRLLEPIVVGSEGDIVLPDPASGSAGGRGNASLEMRPSTVRDVLGGVPLHLLFETKHANTLVRQGNPATTVEVADLTAVLDGVAIKDNHKTYQVTLDGFGRRRLLAGVPVIVLGQVTREVRGKQVTAPEVFRLKPKVASVALDTEELDVALSAHVVNVNGQAATVEPTAAVVAGLLAGVPVTAVANISGQRQLVELRPKDIKGQRRDVDVPARFAVPDLSHWLSNPVVPLKGAMRRVPLSAEAVHKLRTARRGELYLDNVKVELVVGDAHELVGYMPLPDGEPVAWMSPWGERPAWLPSPDEPADFDGEQPHSMPRPQPTPQALKVALFLPWRQQWTLRGFTRGNIISSLCLGANGGEAMIAINSWERRSKALEQSTETDIEQLVDYTATTRDTDDVFTEMTRGQDFQFELGGGVDASYKTLAASISVNVDGSVKNASTLENVARRSTTHMTESVARASTRVRSRRVTKIVEVNETGRSETVTRRFHNPTSRDLTIHFREVLAHYRVTTTFLDKRVGIVVLVPNPLGAVDFNDGLTVRANEEALRLGLLNRSLLDGFDAMRTLRAYEHAKQELQSLAGEAKRIAELDRERVQDNQQKKPDVSPAETELLHVLKDVAAAAQWILPRPLPPGELLRRVGNGGELPAGIRLALYFLEEGERPLPANVRSAGQRWLFYALCSSKVAPAFIDQLKHLADKRPEDLTPEDARALVDTIPTNPTLDTVNSLTDEEKEDAALSNAIESYSRGAGLLPFFSLLNVLREEGLYTAHDAGLAAKAANLQRAWNAYLAKQSEGDATLAGEELAAKAAGKQDEATYLDKLEMKFGTEVIAAARERQEALKRHLNEHGDYYRYVLFQALAPGEQLDELMRQAPQLLVGMFEPRVVAQAGKDLAVPLTAVGQSKLGVMVDQLRDLVKKATDEALQAAGGTEADDLVLPSAGMSMSSHHGSCDIANEHDVASRLVALRHATADADAAEAEAQRRWERLDATPPLLEIDHQPYAAKLVVEGLGTPP
jgi:hypothetical protein